MKSIRAQYVTGKRILVRCDFNVPVDDQLNILDDFRIKRSLPTIEYLIKQDAKIILMSHLDPKETHVADHKFTLDNVAKKLSEYLFRPVEKADNCIGQEVLEKTSSLNTGEVLLLENLRFHEGETKNSSEFAGQLAQLGDVYVNDAFSVCHRSHASIVQIPKILPSCAGLLLSQEIENLTKVLQNPKRPFITIVGGVKVDTKAKFINRILKVADLVIVSGLIKKALMSKLRYRFSRKIVGPKDNLEAPDIDEKAVNMLLEKIMQAKTVLWNGPFGKFEDKKYEYGTLAIARGIIESKAFSVVGGGETVEFLNKEGLLPSFNWVSTGGGAMLDYLSGDELPGLKALS